MEPRKGTAPRDRKGSEREAPDPGEGKVVRGVRVRPARKDDLPALVGLLVRLKRLNGEFDPLLAVRPDAEEQALRVLSADLSNPNSLLLSAEATGADEGKVVGVLRATIRERLCAASLFSRICRIPSGASEIGPGSAQARSKASFFHTFARDAPDSFLRRPPSPAT